MMRLARMNFFVSGSSTDGIGLSVNECEWRCHAVIAHVSGRSAQSQNSELYTT